MSWTLDKNIRSWLPKIQSHRGLWIHGLQQNSLSAIEAAYKNGYEMAEFDVRLTADDVVVLFHDEGFKNKLIRKTNFVELQSLTPITTLEELMTWFVKTKEFKLNIEIKSRDIFNYKLEKKISELIRKYQVENRILVSSFNPICLIKMRLFNTSVYRALLLTFEKGDRDYFFEYFFTSSGLLNFLCRPHVLNLRYQDFSKRYYQLAKRIPIVLWTVNDVAFYYKLKSDIHGIISDSITPEDLKEAKNA